MSLLVFGERGQVGIDMQRQMGPDAPFLLLGRARADLANPDACADLLAAKDEDYAMLVNGTAPGRMAEACAQIGAPLVHISTADVFDGSGDVPWTPKDTPGPLNALGRSKLVGEEAIRRAGGAHVILRTSWVVSAHGDNFLTLLLKRAAQEHRIEVPSDQCGNARGDPQTAQHAPRMHIDRNSAGASLARLAPGDQLHPQ